jgi:hypothetical protein
LGVAAGGVALGGDDGLGATVGGATLGGATLGGAEGAVGLAEGTGEGAIGAAPHAARMSVASSEAARMDLDIVDSDCIDGEKAVVEE